MKEKNVFVLIILLLIILFGCDDDLNSININCVENLEQCNSIILNDSLNLIGLASVEAVSSSGNEILIGSEVSETGGFININGEILWEYTLPEFRATQSAAISIEQGIVIIGVQSSSVLAFNLNGELLWNDDDIEGEITVNTSEDGKIICAVSNRNNILRCYNPKGNIISEYTFNGRGWNGQNIIIQTNPIRYFIQTNSDIIILNEDGDEVGYNNVIDGNSIIDLEVLSGCNEYIVSYSTLNSHNISLYEYPDKLKWTYSDLNFFAFTDIDKNNNIHITSGDTYIKLDKDGNLINTMTDRGGSEIKVSYSGETVVTGRFLGELYYESNIYNFICTE